MHDKLTQEDIRKIQEEIDYRKLVVRQEALEAVKEARAHGDLSENFEYHAAKKMCIRDRIKAVLVDENHRPVASGSHNWENRLENGIWTYSLEDIWAGIQDSYRKMAEDVRGQYGADLRKIRALGFSAMMHGYMVFDKEDRLLTPFRTWRNTMTGEALSLIHI